MIIDLCVSLWDIMILQVVIGSPYLKANQSINQVVEVVTDMEKYNRFVSSQSQMINSEQ